MFSIFTHVMSRDTHSEPGLAMNILQRETTQGKQMIPCAFDLTATTIPCDSRKRFQCPYNVTFSRC